MGKVFRAPLQEHLWRLICHKTSSSTIPGWCLSLLSEISVCATAYTIANATQQPDVPDSAPCPLYVGHHDERTREPW